MRSRFAAYARGLTDYIIATTHPEGPQWQRDETAWRSSIAMFSESTKFRRLRILKDEPGDQRAFVTFEATLEQGGRDASFTERSEFQRVDDRWLYYGGERVE